MDTGTRPLSSSPSVRTPRLRSHRARPPATTARNTSFTVPPSAFLTALKSSSRLSVQNRRRWGPIGTFSGTEGAGFSPAHATSPRPSAASRTEPSVRPGLPAAAMAWPARRCGVPSRPFTPSPSSSAWEGSGAGTQAVSGSGGSAGTAVRSNSTVAMSTPDTPSTSAWWVLEISAKRSSSSPWASQISHSGLDRSRRWLKTLPASWRSCSSDPGAGSAVWRTWYSRLKRGSSIHSGRPISKRGNDSFWR